MERKMTDGERAAVRDVVRMGLSFGISDDYTGRIVDAILDDVVEDVELCADDDYTPDDVRLAVGRALCDRLGIEH